MASSEPNGGQWQKDILIVRIGKIKLGAMDTKLGAMAEMALEVGYNHRNKSGMSKKRDGMVIEKDWTWKEREE